MENINVCFTTEQRENILKILQTHAQWKHLELLIE